METYKISEARVYVGTYAKYNEGSIYGEWIDIDSDKDSFFEKCRELHSDESDPELMFQDWENIPSCFISECSISDQLFELYDDLLELERNDELDAFFKYADYFGHSGMIDSSLIDRFHDQYRGEYDSERAYAEELVYCGIFGEIPDNLINYLDFDAIARDVFMDAYFINGYVFDAC